MADSSSPSTSGGVVHGTLRALFEERKAAGRTFSLEEMVSFVVPLAVDAAELHDQGDQLFLHPSAVARDESGEWHMLPGMHRAPPSHPADRACVAPELRQGQTPGDARASVFAIGAIAYEALTGRVVAPGMRRPSELVPSLGESADLILAKALVAEPGHRPDDLRALAQALHHLAPSGSMAPPAADESHLDHGVGFEVDVSMSMIPPAPRPGGFDMQVQEVPSSKGGAVSELAALKKRLESDPRSRYIVIQGGIDHGPFTAVELLQQIASNAFTADDSLRDTLSQEQRKIADWPEFQPFAHHARLHRVEKAEAAAFERSVEQEKKSTTNKALIGVGALAIVVAGAAGWFLATRGTRTEKLEVTNETATNVETDASLDVKKKGATGGGRGGVVGKSGKYPILAGGTSCEAAQAAYVQDMKLDGSDKPDLSVGQLGAVLNNSGYFGHCGVPASMAVNICAAVQNGRAVGVTVSTDPKNPGISSCIASAVRGLSFPSNPKLDITRTTFAAAK